MPENDLRAELMTAIFRSENFELNYSFVYGIFDRYVSSSFFSLTCMWFCLQESIVPKYNMQLTKRDLNINSDFH